MLRRLDRWKSLGIAGLGALAAVCLCAAAVRAALPAASRPARASATHPVAASQAIADFQAYYETRLAEIKPHDAEGLFSLALLCSNRQRPDLAADLSRQILASWPAHTKAKTLLRASTLRMAATSLPAPASRRR